MPTATEQELIDITGFKARRLYSKRQDYLAALLMAVTDLEDSDFDKLSDDAAAWANLAVRAHKAKKEIADFPGAEELLKAEEEQLMEELRKDVPKTKNKTIPKGVVPMRRLNGEFNRYGVAAGTKSDMVIEMLEEGCTMRQIRDKFNGEAFYNLIKKLVKEGHTCEKDEQGVYTLKFNENAAPK